MTVDLKDLARSPIAIFTTIMIITPIGIGPATFIWSSVGNHWQVNADTVALITAIISGAVSAAGLRFWTMGCR